MKEGLSGSIVNEIEVNERDFLDRKMAIEKLAEIKSRKIERLVIIKEVDGTIRAYNYVKNDKKKN